MQHDRSAYGHRSQYGHQRAQQPPYYPPPATASATSWAPTRQNYIPTPASYASESSWFEPPQYVGGRQSGYGGYSSSGSSLNPPRPAPPSLLEALSVPPSYPYSRPRASSRAASSSSMYNTPYLPTSPLSSAPATPPLASERLIARPVIIKQEQPDDDGFIVDTQPSSSSSSCSSALAHALACAPPTEVPLRATQASARMRRMMGVFRLNPFAIQMQKGENGSRSDCTWAGGEARPLDEPPRVFEFQLALDQPFLPEYGEDNERGGRLEEVAAAPVAVKNEVEMEFNAFSVSLDGLRAFSPEFELESVDAESEPSWELAYPPTYDPSAAYPRALQQPSYNNRFQNVPLKRGYDSTARRWSLPAHAHDPAAAFLM
ncbi:hypothetical protein C8F01DRAFT_1253479 [Mycena amicta]|nr:hypothetical protein C8F01DRAFT_1253479 [Mycena amicta]